MAVFYTFAVYESIVGRFSSSSSDSNADNTEDSAAFVAQWRYLGWLYVGLTYFLVQEIVQLISLISLKASWIWLKDPGNWLNVIYIGFLGSWTVFMSTGWCDRDIFRTGAAISFGFIWIKFLSYLRNILIDFAVFSGGVFHFFKWSLRREAIPPHRRRAAAPKHAKGEHVSLQCFRCLRFS